MATQHLPARADTVRVGVIDRAFAPVLEIDDGDELVLQTWGLWGHAVTPQTTYAELLRLRERHAGVGPHSITGPVRIRQARAGMTLQVDILELQLGPHGFNLISAGPKARGLLAHEYEVGELRHFVLDTVRMQTELVPGLMLPLRPFLGIMGVAPAEAGTRSSVEPGEFGGNIDCPDLVVGTTLFLPVWVDGALFYAGDAHAAQGCGEVTQTALEASFERARLRLQVLPQQRLHRPHAQTAQHLITMGFHPDLRQAAVQAVDDMVSWLCTDYRLSRSEAYVLCSLQADLLITQAVNGHNGVHARVARGLLAPLARRASV